MKTSPDSIPCSCPNCYSRDYIRTTKTSSLDQLFWNPEPITVIVKCIQCNEILYRFKDERF